jgi:DUF2934 family protein
MNRSKRDEIAARAHQIWEEEGRPPNKAEEHWRRAEQDVARQDQSEQMGGSERAPEREVDTRPAPPVDAAPPLDRTADMPDDAAAKKVKPKTGRSRRTRNEPQQR